MSEHHVARPESEADGKSSIRGLPDLSLRCRLPELMDDPDLDANLHRAALAGLRRINLLSHVEGIVWRSLKQMASTQPDKRLAVLDVACGGGDVVVGLMRRARKNGLNLQVDGCDISERAVQYAQEFASAKGESGCRFFKADALSGQLPETYDVVMCSLFLHHLDREDAVQLLKEMSRVSRRAVLVNDLRRTRLGYAMAVIGCRLLTRSPIVHTDGPLSVRAAWSDAEVYELADEAGLRGARLSHHWPQRFLLTWNRE